MVVGHCIAHSYVDAARFILMLDGAFILISAWGWLRNNADEGIAMPQFVSAMIGFPAAVLAKSFDTSQERVAVAMLLSAAAAVSWAYTVIADIQWLNSVRQRIDLGEVSVNSFYWPAQWISIVILVAVSINHGILALFCRRRLRQSAFLNNRGGEYDDIL